MKKRQIAAVLTGLGTICTAAQAQTYTNPLSLNDPKTGPAVSCPDPP